MKSAENRRSKNGDKMKTNHNLPDISSCTGCGCCVNACTNGSLVMDTDKDGFIMPVCNTSKCTDCGSCSAVCPVLSYKSANNVKPRMYSFRASDEIRKVSSSGGVFSLAAKAVLADNGYVCGAAYDEKMHLHHVIVSDEAGLAGIRGSKYVQSFTDDIYRKVKKLLDSGNSVLFSGTPCQCAALRAYLKKDYEKLYVIDVLCHGVPSDAFFHRYLDEQFPEKTVTDVRFRDKKFGWSCNNISISFSDGSRYEANTKKDPYLTAFHRNLSLRESCENCSFSEFPRSGDISLGDFWNISSIDREQNDSKGTSLVYINNEKGRRLFDRISAGGMIKEFDFDTTVIKNRVTCYQPSNQNRYRLFRFMENRRFTLKQAVSRALERQFDIGLVTNYYAANFGGSLTQYALYNTLEDMGYSCLMIERPSEARNKANLSTLNSIYKVMPYKQGALALQRKTKDEMRVLNKFCDAFIVGSDQLFQFGLYNDLGKYVTLDWVDGNKKKIAYAASFGHDHIWGSSKELARMGFFINRFDAFSVREKSGADIARDNFGVRAEHVLDPVFLCDTKHYDELISRSERKLPEHFIGSYMLDPSEEKAAILRQASQKLGIPVCVFSEYHAPDEYTKPFREFDRSDITTEERLEIIKKCDIFITDSFHGTCFSIIMNKPFISIVNSKRGASRFYSLLSFFGFEDRLINDPSDEGWKKLISRPMDFSESNKKLESERKRCKEWLETAIQSSSPYHDTSYDVLIDRIISQEKQIGQLKDMITKLMQKNGTDLRDVSEPIMYLELLASRTKDNIMIVTVKDTPGMSVNTRAAEAFAKLGFETDIMDKHWRSFVGVIDEGNVVYEKLSPDEIVYRTTIDGFKIAAVSRNLNVGNVSKNIVDGVEHSVNRRGLNITVISKTDRKVKDSVNIDMHLEEYTFIRKSDL